VKKTATEYAQTKTHMAERSMNYSVQHPSYFTAPKAHTGNWSGLQAASKTLERWVTAVRILHKKLAYLFKPLSSTNSKRKVDWAQWVCRILRL